MRVGDDVNLHDRGGDWSRMANIDSLCEYRVQLRTGDSFGSITGFEAWTRC